jgi:hypothetical protein
VLGTHPHVVQPLYEETTPEGRQTLIVASTGNFVSNMRILPRRAGLIMHLEFCRAKPAAQESKAPLVLSRARYTPTLMVFDDKGPRLTLNHSGLGGAHKVSRKHTAGLVGIERLLEATPQSLRALSSPEQIRRHKPLQLLSDAKRQPREQSWVAHAPEGRRPWYALTP